MHGGSRCDFLCSPIDPGAADSRRGEVLCPTQSSNGAAIIKRLALGIVACIGDEGETPTLHAFALNERVSIRCKAFTLRQLPSCVAFAKRFCMTLTFR